MSFLVCSCTSKNHGPCFKIDWSNRAAIIRCQTAIENTLKIHGKNNEEYCKNIEWDDKKYCINWSDDSEKINKERCESLPNITRKNCFNALPENEK